MPKTPKPSGGFSLELGPEVANITCADCGKPFKSVNGYMKKDDWTYSVYFTTLQTGHDDIVVGLTVSIGKWWDDLALTAAAVSLDAHAAFKSSSPAAGSVVASTDFPVTLTFNVRADAARSRLELLMPGASTIPLPAGKQPSPNTLA